MPIVLTPEVIQREIDRFARLLISGDTMPLLMLGLDTRSQTITLIAGPVILTRLREDERVQETIITNLRDSLGRLIMGPDGRGEARVEGL